VGGQAFGTMLLGLPEERQTREKALDYLRKQPNVTVEEVRHV
jgi:D-methionine transport system ATP-binding protein